MYNCPECSEPLRSKCFGAVTVDECPSCCGVWFEKGELEEAKDAVDADLNWLDFDVWKSGVNLASRQSARVCPACGVKMVGLTCGHTGVAVDYCHACDGAWLDQHQFHRIIEALQAEVNSKSFSGYVKETLAEARELIGTPSAFLSEWKDFATVVRLMHYRLFVEHPQAVKAILAVHQAVH